MNSDLTSLEIATLILITGGNYFFFGYMFAYFMKAENKIPWYNYDSKVNCILSSLFFLFWLPIALLMLVKWILTSLFYHLPVRFFKFWRNLPDKI